MQFTRRTRFLFLLVASMLSLALREGVADTTSEVRSLLDALANTAVVVEGRVTEITYAFDPKAGPRTIATLSDLITHFGKFDEKTLKVAILGGPISERRWLFIPELPRLTTETRYLLFLTNVNWFYTPIVATYLFQLEPGPQGVDVLIEPSGHAVVRVSPRGLQSTLTSVVEGQLDFLTPHAKRRLLDSERSQLARAVTKPAFLSVVQDLLLIVPLKGEFSRLPTAERVWNRGIASRAQDDDTAPRRKPPDKLVCIDPAPQGKACRDSGDQ
jgi:hypothetical protein